MKKIKQRKLDAFKPVPSLTWINDFISSDLEFVEEKKCK